MGAIMRKTILLIVGLLLIFLSLSIGRITAQSPTEEPTPASETVVILPENAEIVNQESAGNIEVYQVEQTFNLSDYITEIIMGIVMLAMVASKYLSPENLGKARKVSSYSEEIFWKLARAAAQVDEALGNKPDVVVSDDPAKIAAGLKAGENVFIIAGANVDEIVRLLTTPPNV